MFALHIFLYHKYFIEIYHVNIPLCYKKVRAIIIKIRHCVTYKYCCSAASNVYRNAAYVPRTSIQEEILTEAVKNNAPTAAEWLKIKNSVLTNGRLITPITFNANVLGFCVVHKNYQAAKNFLEFIQNNNEQLNLAATGKFMKLYYVCNEISSEYKCDEELILSM